MGPCFVCMIHTGHTRGIQIGCFYASKPWESPWRTRLKGFWIKLGQQLSVNAARLGLDLRLTKSELTWLQGFVPLYKYVYLYIYTYMHVYIYI